MQIVLITLCILTIKFDFSLEYDGLIHVLTKVFAQKHVQTVTDLTCWPSDAKSQLLFKLSSADISVNFFHTIIPAYGTWYKYGILVDVSCTQITSTFIQQASKTRYFNKQNNWMLINSRQNDSNNVRTSEIARETFETHLDEAYVLPESNVFLFIRTDDESWEIWEGFKVGKMEKIQVYKHGTMTGNDLKLLNNVSVSPRTDLRGITLKAATVITEPDKFKGFFPFAKTDLDIFAHMHYDLNMILQDQLNFKINLSIVSSFGWDLGNGTFSGLTGLLQSEECDFGGIGSFIRADRMVVVDYTVGTFYRQQAVLLRQPPLSSVRNICILPFNFEVWMTIFVTFIGFTIIIVFLSGVTKRYKKDDEEMLTILDSVTLVHGAICQQGYTMNVNMVSIRVVIFVLFLTAVFLFTSYSASIVALLQSPSDSIKSVQNLVESSITFSTQINPWSEIYFNETTDPLIRKLYDTKMKPQGTRKFTIASKGIARIRTEFHGFLVEVVSAYQLISQYWYEEEKCGFSEIQLFKLPILALPVIKNSGYKDILKQKLIQQYEVGLKNRIVRRWIPPKPICDSSNRANQFVSVTLKEIYPMLQIYSCGLCIAVVILILEIGYHTNFREKITNVSNLKIFKHIYNKR